MVGFLSLSQALNFAISDQNLLGNEKAAARFFQVSVNTVSSWRDDHSLIPARKLLELYRLICEKLPADTHFRLDFEAMLKNPVQQVCTSYKTVIKSFKNLESYMLSALQEDLSEAMKNTPLEVRVTSYDDFIRQAKSNLIAAP